MALFLAATALILWVGEMRGNYIETRLKKGTKSESGSNPAACKKEAKNNNLIGEIDVSGNGTKKVRFNLFIAVMAGIGQALAIFPGISRSGATISFARFFGKEK